MGFLGKLFGGRNTPISPSQLREKVARLLQGEAGVAELQADEDDPLVLRITAESGNVITANLHNLHQLIANAAPEAEEIDALCAQYVATLREVIQPPEARPDEFFVTARHVLALGEEEAGRMIQAMQNHLPDCTDCHVLARPLKGDLVQVVMQETPSSYRYITISDLQGLTPPLERDAAWDKALASSRETAQALLSMEKQQKPLTILQFGDNSVLAGTFMLFEDVLDAYRRDNGFDRLLIAHPTQDCLILAEDTQEQREEIYAATIQLLQQGGRPQSHCVYLLDGNGRMHVLAQVDPQNMSVNINADVENLG